MLLHFRSRNACSASAEQVHLQQGTKAATECSRGNHEQHAVEHHNVSSQRASAMPVLIGQVCLILRTMQGYSGLILIMAQPEEVAFCTTGS